MYSEENHPFKDHCPSRLHHDLTQKTFDKIIEDALRVKADGETSCLIIDDFFRTTENQSSGIKSEKTDIQTPPYEIKYNNFNTSAKIVTKDITFSIGCSHII